MVPTPAQKPLTQAIPASLTTKEETEIQRYLDAPWTKFDANGRYVGHYLTENVQRIKDVMETIGWLVTVGEESPLGTRPITLQKPV